jgi:hypothetical protein
MENARTSESERIAKAKNKAAGDLERYIKQRRNELIQLH